MLKRLFELLGLATLGVGLYLVFSEQSKNSACNATEGKFAGLGMSASCQHVVYAYFGGFVVLAVGVGSGVRLARHAQGREEASGDGAFTRVPISLGRSHDRRFAAVLMAD